MKKKKYTIAIYLVLMIQLAMMLILSGCGAGTYRSISQDDAMQMMEENTGYLIVDVRRPDEFSEGHIAGAVNVPNEAIQAAEDASELAEDLPDKEQMLFIYCRTGRRSKEASQKLADFGYRNVYEFGGINTWEGETEE